MDGSDAGCTRAEAAAEAGVGAKESSSLADTSLKPSLRRDVGGVGGVGWLGGCRGRAGRDRGRTHAHVHATPC